MNIITIPEKEVPSLLEVLKEATKQDAFATVTQDATIDILGDDLTARHSHNATNSVTLDPSETLRLVEFIESNDKSAYIDIVFGRSIQVFSDTKQMDISRVEINYLDKLLKILYNIFSKKGKR